MPGRCAFLSMDGLEDFVVYDDLTFEPLRALGWSVDTIPWRRPTPWADYDLVVIRSTWDYQSNAAEFMKVLETIDAATRLENSLATVRWNIEKTYLRELTNKGVSIAPTAWFERWDHDGVRKSFETFDAQQIVIKPVVGANADDTFRVLTADFERRGPSIGARFESRAFMVQPFLETVLTDGERSLFFFDGEYSHAVTKTPKASDFRVQEEHGGVIRSFDAPPELRTRAKAALAAAGDPLLYARADFIRHRGTEVLMELELIEPSLYFEFDATAPARFAAALDRRARS